MKLLSGSPLADKLQIPVVSLEWTECLDKRPTDRTSDDLDAIFSKLKDVKAFEKFHPLLIQQLCYYSYFEIVHSRSQAVGMWQALLEEAAITHVSQEHYFKDKYLFYRFTGDESGTLTRPSTAEESECEEQLNDVILTLSQVGPDAMLRMILRKPPHERTIDDLEIIYDELLHIKALSHLSSLVKRELASVLIFEAHPFKGEVLFSQGDEGKSWYIILKASVQCIIYGKGIVGTLHEGDDFGKLSLVNNSPRTATIILNEDNTHFLRVDKDDFNRILRDVEANTIRLKEFGKDVLILDKVPINVKTADGTYQVCYKYSIMSGAAEKILEYLLETYICVNCEEGDTNL
ncbi:unnamed protein product, partial [Rotaria magnacalcarata]